MPRTPAPRGPGTRVRAAVDNLVERGILSPEQADPVVYAVSAALASDGSQPDERDRRGRFAEVGGYVGGAVTAAATLLLLREAWTDLSRPARTILLVGLMVLIAGAGVAIGGGGPARLRTLGREEHSARRRLVGTLFGLAAVAAAAAAGTATERHGSIQASVAGLVVAATGYLLVPTLVGQLACWAGAMGVVLSLIDEATEGVQAVVSGLAVIALGIVWAALARLDVLFEPYAGLGIGAATTLLGAQLVLTEGDYGMLSYALTAAVAVACFVGFVKVRNWLVLATGILAVVLVVPEALNDLTGGSLGGASALLVTGVALLAASALGLRLHRGAHDQ
jgi:hypothetical protein